MKTLKLLAAILIIALPGFGQSLDYFAQHAGDYAIRIRVNFYVVTATPVTIDSAGLAQSLDDVNTLFNGSTQQTIGGIPSGPQMIPTNIFFDINRVYNLVQPLVYDVGQWQNYAGMYEKTGTYQMVFTGDDADSIIDVIFLTNSLQPGTYGAGHTGKGVALFNFAPGYIGGKLLAHELGHALGLRHTFGEGECTGQIGTDFIPDTPPEDCGCEPAQGDTLPSWCTNNFMGYNYHQDYISPQQCGWMRKVLITDLICLGNDCYNMTESLPFGNYGIKRYANVSYLGTEQYTSTSFSVYPNPAKTHFTISTDHTGGTVNIYTLAGTLAGSVQNYQGGTIPVNLAAGVYVVEYAGITSKLIIQ